MKNHHIDNDQLLLYQLNELPESEKNRIKDHLKTCRQCRNALKKESDLAQLYLSSAQTEPDENRLEACRSRLMRKIRNTGPAAMKKSIFNRIQNYFSYPIPVYKLTAVTALLIIGFVAGRFLPGKSHGSFITPAEAVNLLQRDISAANFQILPSRDESDHVEIRFQTTHDARVKGHLRDSSIRYLISYALMNDPRDNVRLKMVKLLESSARETEVQGALIHALEKDENPGVRMKAIKLLKTLPINESIKKILMAALFRDTNTGIRREAADALHHLDDPKIQPILEKKALEDEYTRALLMKNQKTNPALSGSEI